MTTAPITAALTLSLTGRYERQGTDAADGIRLWADAAGARLTIVDDRGSRQVAIEAYRSWLDTVDLLIGPYSSGLVRAITPLVRDTARVLWNHGGSADDLAQPGIASLPAPASSYFNGVVDEAANRKVSRVIVVQAPGPFARAVADGARARASGRGIDSQAIEASAVEGKDVTEAALLVAGPFEHDAAVVRGLRDRGQSPALLAAVAAGISAFGRELGEAAEGVLGPVHWWPRADRPKIGPSGRDFVTQYQRWTGREPSYPAALAAAAGYLAHAAYGLGLEAKDVPGWTTSTLLGGFALDDAWRQVGYRVSTVRWQGGHMAPIAHRASPISEGAWR
jgi:ABC-type branched-subunit amino acid transport system substrate-binding protein